MATWQDLDSESGPDKDDAGNDATMTSEAERESD
jgi:hypothetical protein